MGRFVKLCLLLAGLWIFGNGFVNNGWGQEVGIPTTSPITDKDSTQSAPGARNGGEAAVDRMINPEISTKKAAKPGKVIVLNNSTYTINISLDNVSMGTLPPKYKMTIKKVSAGNHTLYGSSGNVHWGPRAFSLAPRGTYTWTLID